jgi:hypothetical protein
MTSSERLPVVVVLVSDLTPVDQLKVGGAGGTIDEIKVAGWGQQ